ncbi:MAG: hypothetical protein IH614_17350 [Desulfuromonadales bacterium]|nr:hypothetical protein [Desulfuromonadales bacterium]
MNLSQLEHLLRAAGAITEDREFYVIGSQAILPSLVPGKEVPLELWRSMEADLAPVQHPERWALIEGSIGEGSPFHETFGYHADGVEEGTAILPSGWKDRVIRYHSSRTGEVTGLCLEPHDLLISKYCAGRTKDMEFNRAVIGLGLVEKEVLLGRLVLTDLGEEMRQVVQERIKKNFAE